jgi:sugar O-acyltransferase (sialic acid O-acetyltransferase NeuD family)
VRLVLYAVASPYAVEALETARRLRWEIAACVHNLPGAAVPREIEATLAPDSLGVALLALPFIVALTTPGHRHAATADARGLGFGEPATMIDPTAVVAASSTLGEGSYVNAGAIIAAGVRAGTSLSVNRGASIGHHNVIGNYVTVGPGVVTGGECRIQRGAFLGVGAVLAPGVEVGPNAVVGAGAVVIGDVREGAVVVGNPARVVGDGPGYHGVGVPPGA